MWIAGPLTSISCQPVVNVQCVFSWVPCRDQAVITWLNSDWYVAGTGRAGLSWLQTGLPSASRRHATASDTPARTYGTASTLHRPISSTTARVRDRVREAVPLELRRPTAGSCAGLARRRVVPANGRQQARRHHWAKYNAKRPATNWLTARYGGWSPSVDRVVCRAHGEAWPRSRRSRRSCQSQVSS